MDYIEILLPVEENFTPQQKRGIERLREDMRMRYFDAPDLKDVGNNGYRFINAVSDFATHSTPRRKTANYKENIFARTTDGNPLIDRHIRWCWQHKGEQMKKVRKILLIFLGICLACTTVSCAKRTEGKKRRFLYFNCLNSDRTGLQKVSYESKEKDPLKAAKAMIKELKKAV